jgi:hypothetical protein
MEAFKTQFIMSGVRTDVTVQAFEDNTFNCTLNLADFFDGGEFEGSQKEPDITLKHLPNGTWEIVGNSKITLTTHDAENLEKAIEEDYLNR